jgi:hypothetical protein
LIRGIVLSTILDSTLGCAGSSFCPKYHCMLRDKISQIFKPSQARRSILRTLQRNQGNSVLKQLYYSYKIPLITLDHVNYLVLERPDQKLDHSFIILLKYRNHISSDSRDKVYGLIALADIKARLFDQLRINYSQSPSDVHLATAKTVVKFTGRLDIIYKSKPRALSPEDITPPNRGKTFPLRFHTGVYLLRCITCSISIDQQSLALLPLGIFA